MLLAIGGTQPWPNFQSVGLQPEVWYLVLAFAGFSLVLISVLAVRVITGRLPLRRFVLLSAGFAVALLLASYLAWITTYGSIM